MAAPSFLTLVVLVAASAVDLGPRPASAQVEPLSLPPLPFVEAFVRLQSLAGVEIRTPVRQEYVADLVRYRKRMRSYPASVLNSLHFGAPSTASAGAPANCTSMCSVRNLQLVPYQTGWRDRVRLAFQMRPHADQDYWLIGTEAAGEEGRQQAHELARSLPLDLDDQVYFYVRTETGDPDRLLLLEAYKVLPAMGPILQDYGEWDPAAEDPDGVTSSSTPGALLLASDDEIWQRRRDMQGVTFRVSTLLSRPYITWLEFGSRRVGEPVKMTGMFADVFHAMQEIMNFTYVLGSPEDGQWGANQGDGSWSGMVGQLQRQEIDMAATDFTVTQERSAVMTFAEPITQIYHSLFIKNPAGTPNYTAYIEPFQKWVWFVLIFLIVFTPPFYFMAVSFGPFYETNLSEFTLGKSYVFAASVLTFMRPWSVTPSTDRGKFAFGCLLCGGTLIYYHWEAMLISYLATRVIVLPFNSLEELVSASDFMISLTPGSSYADAFKYSLDPLWQEAWATRIEPEIDTYPRGEDLAQLIMDRPEYAMYDNFFAVRTYAAYSDCQIIAVPEKYDIKPYAYGFQKDSPFLGPFNFYLNQMRERGTTKKILEVYESRPQVCPDYSGKPLGLDTCFTAFGLLVMGLMVGTALFFLEKGIMETGRFLNIDLSLLESYGMLLDTEKDEDVLMADPTFDERAKDIIHDKNEQILELKRMLRKSQGHANRDLFSFKSGKSGGGANFRGSAASAAAAGTNWVDGWSDKYAPYRGAGRSKFS